MDDIVDVLRSKQPLPICPFDRRSPEYWTTPDDKPCKFCGSLPEGEDKCTGADTRIMGQAADLIETLRSDISRLTKALETIAFAPQGACGPDLAESIAIARAAIRQESDVPTASALSADATCDKLAASNTGGSDEPALLASTTAFAEPHSDGGGSVDRSRPAGETIGHPGPVHGGRAGTDDTPAYPGIRNSDAILSLLPSADVPTDVNDMPEGEKP